MNLFKLRFNSKYFIPIILSFLLNTFSQTRDSTSAPALPIKQPIKPTISDTSAKKPLARDTGSIKTKPIDTSATAKTKAATDTGKISLPIRFTIAPKADISITMWKTKPCT